MTCVEMSFYVIPFCLLLISRGQHGICSLKVHIRVVATFKKLNCCLDLRKGQIHIFEILSKLTLRCGHWSTQMTKILLTPLSFVDVIIKGTHKGGGLVATFKKLYCCSDVLSIRVGTFFNLRPVWR